MDFIDLLSKLSPIAIAGALDNGKFGSTFLRTAGLPEDEKADQAAHPAQRPDVIC